MNVRERGTTYVTLFYLHFPVLFTSMAPFIVLVVPHHLRHRRDVRGHAPHRLVRPFLLSFPSFNPLMNRGDIEQERDEDRRNHLRRRRRLHRSL